MSRKLKLTPGVRKEIVSWCEALLACGRERDVLREWRQKKMRLGSLSQLAFKLGISHNTAYKVTRDWKNYDPARRRANYKAKAGKLRGTLQKRVTNLDPGCGIRND